MCLIVTELADRQAAREGVQVGYLSMELVSADDGTRSLMVNCHEIFVRVL